MAVTSAADAGAERINREMMVAECHIANVSSRQELAHHSIDPATSKTTTPAHKAKHKNRIFSATCRMFFLMACEAGHYIPVGFLEGLIGAT